MIIFVTLFMVVCCVCFVFTDGESSTKLTPGKVVTPPSSANGHLPRDSQENAANGSGILESGKQTNKETERGTADGAPHVEENAKDLDNTAPENSGSSTQQNQFKKEESTEDAAPTSDGKVTAENEQPVILISGTAVGEVGGVGASNGNDVNPEDVERKPSETVDVSSGDEPGAGASETDLVQNKVASEALEGKSSGIEGVSVGDEPGAGASETDSVQNKAASQVSLSGENETGPSPNETNIASATGGIDNGASETDLPQHRIATEPSLSEEIPTAPVVDQSKRASIAASEHSPVPSNNEVNLSRQNRGSVELDSVSPTPVESTQPTQPREISQEDSSSLVEKESTFPVVASGSSQPTEASGEDSLALGRKDSAGHHAVVNDGFSVENIHGRICTLTANVQIGSLDDPQGERTVTLHGSVYRLPGITTPKPGDKIGFVTGEVTSTPVDNESSTKVATLRGDLLAVSGEASSHGQIATASIDVLSCSNGEKIATITADVAPNDSDSDSASGVILGEVLGASESGSYDEKIGTLAGTVVALTFDEDTISITSLDEEFLKQRRESCFI